MQQRKWTIMVFKDDGDCCIRGKDYLADGGQECKKCAPRLSSYSKTSHSHQGSLWKRRLDSGEIGGEIWRQAKHYNQLKLSTQATTVFRTLSHTLSPGEEACLEINLLPRPLRHSLQSQAIRERARLPYEPSCL